MLSIVLSLKTSTYLKACRYVGLDLGSFFLCRVCTPHENKLVWREACCGQRPQAGLIVKEQSADAPDVTYDVTTPTSPRLAVLPDEFL